MKQVKAVAIEINDLVFRGKNKAYGAYQLRRLYRRNLSIAVVSGSLVFSAMLSVPLLRAWMAGDPLQGIPRRADAVVTLGYAELPTPKIAVPADALVPHKATIKFTPPVVLPDAKVIDDYIPTQDDLAKVDPGTVTVKGDPGAIDVILTDPPPVPDPAPVQAEEMPFAAVENMPAFPGGDAELVSYMVGSLKYPPLAIRVGIEGKVFVAFVVEKDGSITGAAVVKGIGGGCDEEALRVLQGMPRWVPGRQNGTAVRVKMTIPVVFRLR